MEPWEQSLDVDDSDHHLHPLRRCTTTSQSQTLEYISPSQNLTSASKHQFQSPPQVRTIPGPAGIVQTAKRRKTRDSENWLGQEEELMATQDYIRKVVEDPMEDEDFKRGPWISAMEFVRVDGGFNSGSSLGGIDKCKTNGKIDQVVAVIKSCTPNGLGDMTVALKDPTGTVSGTIHHKVLTEGDFRKGICVGSVLILHKVSVFSPSRSTHYLNITKRNLVKVFYKDGGSSQKQTFHETIDATPHYDLSTEDPVQGTPALGSAFHLERGAEGITNRMKRSNSNNEQENMNCTSTSNKGTNPKVATDKETLLEANVKENVGPLSEGSANGFEGVKALLPNWTDEQLLQLSDWDDI